MSHYRITPLEKKSISVIYEMYRENDDGSISWFNIEDHYRWGQGFIAEDMDCNLGSAEDQVQYCKMEDGEHEGCEFDDSVAVFFAFSDDLTEIEQEAIKESYYDGGAGWLFDGDHSWQEEDSAVLVQAPYKVEFCKEDGTVIREVKLRTEEEWRKLYEETGKFVSKDSGLNENN